MDSNELDAGARVTEREAGWATLMRAANAGDATAYQQLLKALVPLLRSVARRGLARARLPEIDAEDVVQETLLAIHLKRHTWDEGRPIGPWIQAIVHNKLIDHLRRRRGRGDIPIYGLEEILAASDEKPTIEKRDVERYLGSLPRRQRDVIQAILCDEASIRETGEKLKMTEGAVRVALHRGLAALATRFKRDES